NGIFYKREIQYDGINRKIIMEKPSGKYISHFKVLRLIFHGFQSEMKSLRVNGKPVKLHTRPAGLFLKSYQQSSDKDLLSVTVANTPQQIILKW
ncbi:hypothetical protein MNBD_BACTEROID07-1408, partial [hydrothermal vent metagenome]